jgi:hypothetical protein
MNVSSSFQEFERLYNKINFRNPSFVQILPICLPDNSLNTGCFSTKHIFLQTIDKSSQQKNFSHFICTQKPVLKSTGVKFEMTVQYVSDMKTSKQITRRSS